MATERIHCANCRHSTYNPYDPVDSCPLCGSDQIDVTRSGVPLPFAVEQAATPVAIALSNQGMYLDRAVDAAINEVSPIPVRNYDPASLQFFQGSLQNRRNKRGKFGGGRVPTRTHY